MTDTAQTTLEAALDHLGQVLYATAGLPVDERCIAMDEALAFYNAVRPGWRVELRVDAQKSPSERTLDRHPPDETSAANFWLGFIVGGISFTAAAAIWMFMSWTN
jgi:hypothetical protein